MVFRYLPRTASTYAVTAIYGEAIADARPLPVTEPAEIADPEAAGTAGVHEDVRGPRVPSPRGRRRRGKRRLCMSLVPSVEFTSTSVPFGACSERDALLFFTMHATQS